MPYQNTPGMPGQYKPPLPGGPMGQAPGLGPTGRPAGLGPMAGQPMGPGPAQAPGGAQPPAADDNVSPFIRKMRSLGYTKESFQNLSPEERAALARDWGGERADLGAQMVQAQALRDAPGPEGTRAGGMYIAASPLEHLTSGVSKYRAGKDLKGMQGQLGDLRTGEREGTDRLMQAVMRARGG